MVGGRDLLESGLQRLIREVFEEGWEFGSDGLPNTECGYAESEEAHARHDKKLHKLLISYFDGEARDVGAQDEADLGYFGAFKPTGFDEITSEFTKQLSFRFPNHGLVKPVGHCKLEKMPDGSVHAVIKYY